MILNVASNGTARNAPGTPPLPRVLLVVDEFQEFFVEDDKVAQEAARVLDRLVRQGRAFGVYILLGSQSLGGAQTMPRTTLGQMAVRVALQCSVSMAVCCAGQSRGITNSSSRGNGERMDSGDGTNEVKCRNRLSFPKIFP